MLVHRTLVGKGRGPGEGNFEKNGWRSRGIYKKKAEGEKIIVVCLK